MSLRLLAGAVLGLLVALVGYDAASVTLAADRHERGRAVYNFRCYFCHGYSGDARTLATSYMTPKPRDFTRGGIDLVAVKQAVIHGRAGTGMKSYAGVIDADEIDAVAGFVMREFVEQRARNTAYHTAGNGWPAHERFAAAYPFAKGELALDAAALTEDQQAGRRLFMTSCISCHDRARVDDEGPAWSSRPVSFPRPGFVPGQPNLPPVDAVSSASVYAKHEVVPDISGRPPQLRRGQALFQANCAFCHGGDGSGRNWIGQFMQPKARDLTQYTLATMPAARLRERIRDGLEGTSMPAWRHVLKAAEIDAVADYVSQVLYRGDAALAAR